MSSKYLEDTPPTTIYKYSYIPFNIDLEKEPYNKPHRIYDIWNISILNMLPYPYIPFNIALEKEPYNKPPTIFTIFGVSYI